MDRRHQPLSRTMSHTLRRLLTLAGVAAVPVLVLCVFFVLPVSGMLAEGFVAGRHLRPGRRRGGAGPAAGAPGAVVHALVRGRGHAGDGAARVPAAHVLYRLRFPGQRLLRAALLMPFVLPTVVVGRRVPPGARRRRPARPGSASTAPRRRSSRRWPSSTSPSWSAPSAPPGRASTRVPARRPRRSGASPGQVFRRSRCPRWPARSSPRPAWSSCSAPPRSASC